MLRDYAALGCSELWNHARLKEYVAAGFAPPGWTVHGCSCGELRELFAADPDNYDSNYTTPDGSDGGDPAPWYDPQVPDSADFAGLLVLEIEGLEDSPIYRTPRDTLNSGSVIGRERVRGREIRVRGILLGRTCCSIDFGMRQLIQMLRGCSGTCAGDCSGDQLEALRCCPDTHLQGCSSGLAGEDGELDYSAFLTRNLRCFRDVGLVEGPRVVDRHGAGCGSCGAGCEVLEVEFTLVAGDPWAYTLGEDVITEEPLPVGDGECIEWRLVGDGDATTGCSCAPAECSVTDPKCATNVEPPTYANPVDDCCCEPLDVARTVVPIESELLTEWFEAVPVIEVYSGRAPLRNVTVRFHPNPLGLDCADLDLDDDCNGCASLRVAYLEAGQTMTLDGRTRRATLTCPGDIKSDGSSVLFGADCESPVVWPVLTCGGEGGYCVVIEADQSVPVSAEAHVTITLHGREM